MTAPASPFHGGMRVIGITGGMASGKSTVAAMFDAPTTRRLDADALVHQLMQHDADTIAAIAAAFPEAMAQGRIERSRLADTISTAPERLPVLEHILHPRVRAAEEAFIATARAEGARAAILDIPLLFETDAHMLCDTTIVVHAPLDHRRRRAFARPGMTEAKWERLLARQLPDHERNPRADILIATDTDEAHTRAEVMKLMRAWQLL